MVAGGPGAEGRAGDPVPGEPMGHSGREDWAGKLWTTIGRRAGPGTPVLPPPAPRRGAPGSPSPAAPGAGERYEILGTVGRGGMSVVFRARDRKLRREVAIKALRPDVAREPLAVSRMIREARAIASLNHPNILKLYDVGEQAPPFLVMEYVRGVTLHQAIAGGLWTLEERARVLDQVSRAVDAAHRHGVIHRDLKPGNILVEQTGRAVVLDFGLAHLASAEARLTRTGAVLGTPQYMAPEQVRGEGDRVDRRTDIYALGVMLYEAMTGRLPHMAATAAGLYEKILHEEAPPPRRINRHVPRDLETICLRAMSHDPRDRYATALDLAEDLRSALAGEPIDARPIGAPTRLLRRLARRKGTVLAAAALAALAASALGLWTALREREARLQDREARLTETQRSILSQLRVTSGACLEAALDLRRAGNLAAMQRHAARMEEICRKVSRDLPELAEPHYRWGRMLRAQMRDAEAFAEQERALAVEPDYPPALYERVVLRVREYRRRVRVLEEEALREEGRRRLRDADGQILPGAGRALPSRTELALKDPRALELNLRITDDLFRLESVAPRLDQGEVACARALRLWVAGSDRKARRLLEDVVRIRPDLEDAFEALAELDYEAGRHAEAIAWLTEGERRDRGYVPHLERRAFVRLAWAASMRGRGEDAGPLFEASVADHDEVLKRAPDRDSALVGRARARLAWASWKADRGEDPDPLHAAAMVDLAEALRRDPARPETWSFRGVAHGGMAASNGTRGEAPDPYFAAAIGDFGEALARDPESEEARRERGIVRMNWGFARASAGRDPEELFAAAIADFGEALRRNPRRADTWRRRAEARVHLADLTGARGCGPEPLYTAAVADYDEALKLDPPEDAFWAGRGDARARWANHRSSRGQDAGSLYAAAVADLGVALGLRPEKDAVWRLRGDVWSDWGLARDGQGGDPGAEYASALRDFDESLRLNPRPEAGWTRRANLRANWGMARMGRGEDPVEVFEAAVADYGEALARDAKRDEPWLGRGAARAAWAQHVHRSGEDPQAMYEQSILDHGEALARVPGRAAAWLGRGVARLNLWVYRRGQGGASDALCSDALADLTRAMELNPSHAITSMQRGIAHFNRACSRERRKEKAGADHRAALEDFRRAAVLNPLLEERVRPQAEASRRYLEGHAGE